MISSLCSLIVVTLDFPSTRSYRWISLREGSSRYSLLGSGCPSRSLNCEKLNLNSRPVTSFRVEFLIRVHRGHRKMNSGVDNHMINTNCSSSHGRKALCCKMSVEFDVFLESNEKWFCHFDDDNYVNVPRLATLLANYSPQEDWYLGKPSIRAPLVILNREDKNFSKNRQNVTFWFATGGAGFCLSRALALKMKPIAGSGKFISIGERIRLPDDVTMGYIIEHMLGKSLTMVDEFHSHLEPMKFLGQDTFQDQITFSYSQYGKDDWNVVKIDGFAPRIDRTRFLSLHCYLFPYFTFCPR
ncbi:fringe glycosyltransferase isoform X2 [Bemisia tabaci]|uniref:fringe glycosyltransferase isoform X2 n=1 Tax=Bemisia tabaci TaxID=7038 RepID=UPI003B283C2A